MKTRPLSVIAVALATLALAALPGVAQEKKGDSAEKFQNLFEKMDRNGDGKLDFKEIRSSGQFEKDTFDKFDANHDGALTPDEFKAGFKAHPDKTPADWKSLLEAKHEQRDELSDSELKAAFDRLDSDHDGKVSWKEAERAETKRDTFDRYDLDADGSVTLAEFEEQYVAEQQKKGRAVAKHIAEKIRTARQADFDFALSEKAMAALDKDKDGFVAYDEIATRVPARRKNATTWIAPTFEQSDLNHDKKLDTAEWSAFQKSIKGWIETGDSSLRDKAKAHAEKAKEKGRP